MTADIRQFTHNQHKRENRNFPQAPVARAPILLGTRPGHMRQGARFSQGARFKWVATAMRWGRLQERFSREG